MFVWAYLSSGWPDLHGHRKSEALTVINHHA